MHLPRAGRWDVISTRPANSRCRWCGSTVLWAVLPSGTSVPLDRSPAGPIRLLRGERLEAVFLSTAELNEVFAQQRLAMEAGEQPEQLYALHPESCRQGAKEIQNRRPRRRGRRRARR